MNDLSDNSDDGQHDVPGFMRSEEFDALPDLLKALWRILNAHRHQGQSSLKFHLAIELTPLPKKLKLSLGGSENTPQKELYKFTAENGGLTYTCAIDQPPRRETIYESCTGTFDDPEIFFAALIQTGYQVPPRLILNLNQGERDIRLNHRDLSRMRRNIPAPVERKPLGPSLNR